MSSKLSKKILLTVVFFLTFQAVFSLMFDISSEKAQLLEGAYSKAEGLNKRMFGFLFNTFGTMDDSGVHKALEEMQVGEENEVLEIKLVSQDLSETFIDKETAKKFKIKESQFPRDEMEKGVLAGDTFKEETEIDLKGKKYKAIRFISPVRAIKRCLACHNVKEGDVLAAFSSTISLEEIYRSIQTRALENSLLTGVGFLFTLTILSFFLHRMVIVPVGEVSRVARLVAKEGDLSRRIEIQSRDEIGELAESFNEMTENLSKTLVSKAELSAINQQLRAGEQHLKSANQQLKAGEQELKAVNQQLTAKEQELKARMSDLERFNKIMIGRELVMVELKGEVNSLLQQLGQPVKYETPEKIKNEQDHSSRHGPG